MISTLLRWRRRARLRAEMFELREKLKRFSRARETAQRDGAIFPSFLSRHEDRILLRMQEISRELKEGKP